VKFRWRAWRFFRAIRANGPDASIAEARIALLSEDGCYAFSWEYSLNDKDSAKNQHPFPRGPLALCVQSNASALGQQVDGAALIHQIDTAAWRGSITSQLHCDGALLSL